MVSLADDFRRRSWTESASSSNTDDHESTSVWTPDEALVAAPALLMWLIVKRPLAERGRILTVGHEQTIGRGKDADIRWDDPRLSRLHARFTLEPHPQDSGRQAFFIWPLMARHSILVDGQPIRGATLLAENSQVQLGDTVFVVKLLD
ncbi:MAG: FHA domain-containing protein [Anaerolineae bacterium]|nr:FHA domain-containing protein [Anaerolineae bacterium]MDW8171746.1 FHA domain-containing protein [Anaerolineae bacterium]